MSKIKRKDKKYIYSKSLKRPKIFRSFSDCVKWLKKSVYMVIRGRKFKIDNDI